MTTTPFSIRFLPDCRTWTAAGPTPLSAAAASAGIFLEQPCGGVATCGACRVRVVEGELPVTAADAEHLTAEERLAGWRLACQAVCVDSVTVEIPAVSRAAGGKSFGGELAPEDLARPVIDVMSVQLPAGDRDQVSLLDRVSMAAGRGVRGLTASVTALDELVAAAREPAGPVGVAIHAGEVVAAWPGPLLGRYGLAIDIGTTSLAAAVVRLTDGAVAASGAALNPQAAFGADVIARIRFASESPNGLRRLTAAVREGIRALVGALIEETGCLPGDIVSAALAGNPTMMHAWAGVTPDGLGTAPYSAAWSGALECRGRDVELPVHPNAPVFGFPLVRSHVGGDLVAAAVSCGFDEGAGRRLLIDLGTNSEILAADGRRFVAASGAAGPAFEGGSIHHGMRAAPGAIDVVAIEGDGDVVAGTVDDAPPVGICGSGLIDLVAELRRVGVIDPGGRLLAAEALPPGVPARLVGRITSVNGQRAFRVRGDVLLTARDVREVQLATGAIRTAAIVACRALGFEPADLDEVLLAGAFGNYVRKASALRIGLVPPIDPWRVRFVGNAAGVGARLALVDQAVRTRGARLAADARYLDLATHPGYQDTFLSSLTL